MSPSQLSPISLLPNPFARDVVGSPLDDAKADVPRINQAASEKCLKLVDRVAAQQESESLLLFGEPGSGKTHLLSRLRAHLDRYQAQRPVLFVSLRMQTSASMIWRFVRREMAGALLRRGLTDIISPDKRQALDTILQRDLGIVLENLLAGVRVRDAAAWLQGDDLPEEALLDLGLSRQPVDEEYQEDRAQQVIRELAQVLAPVPVVFCLDQVEALQKHPKDEEGIFALGKLVATLHDMLRNAAIVTCVQTSFLDAIKATVRGSEQDRMLSNREGLFPLTWEQAATLVRARLDSQPEIRAQRTPDSPPYWPIDLEKLRTVFDAGGRCVARRVLHRARELFDEAANCPPSELEPLDAYLSRSFEERLSTQPPENADHILRDVLPSLFQLLGIPIEDSGKPARARVFDVLVQHNGRSTAFALCNQKPGVGLVNRLRKLGEKWDSTVVPRLVLLRDARLGIGTQAKASQQRLAELREKNAELVNVSPEALAALHALRGLLADAGSGDLSHGADTVTRRSVEQWLLAHMPEPLAELVDQLTGETGRGLSHLIPALTAFLNERKVASLAETAQELKASEKEVADCARQNPVQFALLDGRDPVLFQPVRHSPGH
jgi:hypothetical protein